MITDNKHINLFVWLIEIALAQLLWSFSFKIAAIMVGVASLFTLFSYTFMSLKNRGGFGF